MINRLLIRLGVKLSCLGAQESYHQFGGAQILGKIRVMPLQLREIGFHVQNHATQWHGFQHEIQFQEIVVAWIQLTPNTLGSK